MEIAAAPEAEDISAGSAQESPGPSVSQAQAVQPAAGKIRNNNVLSLILIVAVIAVIVVVNVIMALLPTDEDRGRSNGSKMLPLYGCRWPMRQIFKNIFAVGFCWVVSDREGFGDADEFIRQQ